MVCSKDLKDIFRQSLKNKITIQFYFVVQNKYPKINECLLEVFNIMNNEIVRLINMYKMTFDQTKELFIYIVFTNK